MRDYIFMMKRPPKGWNGKVATGNWGYSDVGKDSHSSITKRSTKRSTSKARRRLDKNIIKEGV